MRILSRIFSCRITSPTPARECVDYSGNAVPMLTANSLTVEFLPGYNFTGNLSGTFMQTDSGRVLTAALAGTFEPSLGERTKLFTKTGSLTLQGIFADTNGEYVTDLQVVSSAGGLEGTTGNLYLSWPSDPEAEDKTIYYVGTFCMLPNPE